VYAAYKHTVHGIAAVLAAKPKTDVDYIEHAVVTGDTPQGERDRVFTTFQNTPKYKTIIAHPGCMSHGLTLTSASTIIWWGPLTSWETTEQADARITRVGQKHKQQIIHLQSTPVEKKVYALLRSKQDAQGKLLSLFEDQTLAALED
jgi:SNF2 family DNA or RNA helicase